MNYNSVAAGVVLNFVSLKTACPLWRSVCCTGTVCNLILQFYRGYDSTSKGVRSIIRVDCSIIIRCCCNMPVQITTGFPPVWSHARPQTWYHFLSLYLRVSWWAASAKALARTFICSVLCSSSDSFSPLSKRAWNKADCFELILF